MTFRKSGTKRNVQTILRMVVLGGLISVWCGGCSVLFFPERLLAGNWSVATLETSSLPATGFKISAEGRLTAVDFTVGGAVVSPAIQDSSVKLLGKSVTIKATFAAGSLTFTGTTDSLDQDDMSVTGRISVDVQAGTVPIIVLDSPARMQKLLLE